jgi:hypothetical protein
VAATINAGTAAAQARTMNRLMRIVPFPLVVVEIKRWVPGPEKSMCQTGVSCL